MSSLWALVLSSFPTLYANVRLLGIRRLFRGNKIGSSEQRTVGRQPRRNRLDGRIAQRRAFGQRSRSKIKNLDDSLTRSHQVLRLDIAVYHSSLMSILQPILSPSPKKDNWKRRSNMKQKILPARELYYVASTDQNIKGENVSRRVFVTSKRMGRETKFSQKTQYFQGFLRPRFSLIDH